MKVLSILFSAIICLSLAPISALDVDLTSSSSICKAQTDIVNSLMDYYDGYREGGVIGLFKSPYYWWEAGEIWGGMIQLWYFCKNTTYEDLIYVSLMHQKGDGNDYIPSNQSTTEGNDDQGFWGIAVMDAAERNFTNPPSSEPGWLALVQAVVATMNARWDTDNCNGGLRWQIFTWNNGYNYKNTVSNGCLFHLAARLARYTSNDTYANIAEKTWDWLVEIEFVAINGDTYNIYDGGTVESSCKTLTKYEWSYNYGLMISGAAYMYSYTKNETWLTHVQNMLSTAKSTFFKNGIMYEAACESANSCNNDQKTFKGVLSRMLAQTAVLVPDVYDTIRPLLKSSAAAAAKSCSGSNNICGVQWTKEAYDNNYGLGQQFSAMEVLTAVIATENKTSNNSNSSGSSVPLSNSTGGTSLGNNNAGGTTTKELSQNDLKITSKDKAGAAITTAVVLGIVVGGGVWMLF